MSGGMKGGQKLIGPPKKATKASRAKARKHLGYGLKIYGLKTAPGRFAAKKLSKVLGLPDVEAKAHDYLLKAARGAGKLLGKGYNRAKGLSPKPTPQRKTAPKRKTATLGSRSMRRTRK